MTEWINFRPIGNPALPGLYRGASPDLIKCSTAKDVLDSHGIQYLLDLRSHGEQGEQSTYLTDDMIYKNIPLIEESNFFKRILYPSSQDYIQYYDRILSTNASALHQCLTFINEALNANANLVLFCHAGKDRTGILSCMLLMLANRSKEHIVEDYTLSAKQLTKHIDCFAKHWQKRGIEKEDYLPRMQPKAVVIEHVIDSIEAKGGWSGYFASHNITL